MTQYVNPSTRVGGTTRVVVPERENTAVVDEAPFDDEQYVRINGEWVPVDVPVPEPDTIAPGPPTGLASSGSYVAATGAVDYELTWDAPTVNEDASPLTDLAYYVVRWRYSGGSAWTSFVSNDEAFQLNGLTPGEDVEWEVLARDTSGNDSTWAADLISGVTDVTPPAQPTPPSLSSTLGTIRVTWDGLLAGSTPPPPDFSRLEVFVSTASGGPWTLVGQLSGPGSVLVTGVPLGETRWLSTVAVDTSGNESTRSTAVSVVVVGVTGDDIEAGSITANDIAAGAFTASFTLTGELVAGDPTGARVEISDAGIFGYRSDGSVRAAIPTNDEGSVVLEGDLIADSLTSRDQYSMQGDNNEIAKGGKLILSDGTSSPISPPNVSVLYEKFDGQLTEYLYNQRGFHLDADDGLRMSMCSFFGETGFHYGTGKHHMPRIVPGTDLDFSEWDVIASTLVYVGSAPRIVSAGSKRSLDGSTITPKIRTYDPTTMISDGSVAPVQKVEAQPAWLVQSGWTVGHHVGRCIGASGSESTYKSWFCMAQTGYSSETIRLTRHSVTDSGITEQGNVTVAFPFTEEGDGTQGVVYGNTTRMGFPGTSQYVYVVFGKTKAYVYSSTGTRLSSLDFPLTSGGEHFDATGDAAANGFVGFRACPSYQADHGETRWVTKYTNEHWDSGTTSDTWWASSTWHDPDATGGTHETAQGPLRAIALPKRAALLVTVPPYPARPDPTTTDDVTAAKVYIGRGSTEPARTEMKYAGQTDDPNRALTVRSMPAGAAPPATSDFPASAPALVTSADGISWYLQGDGTAFFDGPEIVDMMSSGLLTHDGDVDVVGDTVLDGDLRVTGMLMVEDGSNTYANRVVDPELLDTPVGTLPYSATFSTYSDQWSVVYYTLGASGAYAASCDAGQGISGGKALKLALSTAGAPANELDLKSPHFDVVPGATYALGAWVRKTEGGTAKTYLRLMGGSDDTLSLYSGRGGGAMAHEVGWYWAGENVSQNWTWAATVLTIPVGVTRAAVRILNYQPPSGSTHYWHGFKVQRLGPGFTGDTGTIRASSMLNSWVNYVDWTPDPGAGTYNPVEMRRVGPMVYFGGMVKSGSSVTADVIQLPYGFRPRNKRIENGQVSGQGLARVDFNPGGIVSPAGGASLSWTKLPTVSFPAADAQ